MPDPVAESMSSKSSTDAAGLAKALAEALRRRVHGDVRFDSASLALYATDASNYRQVPIGVVMPHGPDDVEAAISVCREFGAPLLPRGGGTSLAGQCCNVAVILDFTRYMNNIIEVDPQHRIARVQPGVVLDHLRNAAEKFHLTFAPDPATHDRCSIGGMIGNNSCGVHSVMAGKTDDNIEELEVVTYDGLRLRVGADFIRAHGETDALVRPRGAEVSRRTRAEQISNSLNQIGDQYANLIRTKFPNIPRRVSGYNLNHLLPENVHLARSLVGSEGTCVTVLEATCRLVESPPARVLAVIAYPDIFQCADRIPEIMEQKPIGLEGIDDILVGYTRRKGINTEGLNLLPQGGGWLLVEFGASTTKEAEAQVRALIAALNRSATPPNVRLCSGEQAKRIWEVRESSLGVTSHVPGEPLNWEGWEDSAVAPEKLGAYLRDLRKLMDAFGYKGSLYGHFGHACVHTRLNFDFQSKEGIAKFRKFVEEAADLVLGYGGSISGEHGDGQARAEFLPKMFGSELIDAFRKFKSVWDPDWKMNPGKLIGPSGESPNKLDANLRLGADYAPWQPATHFQFPDDHGSLAQATLRCVGVGKCRRDVDGKDGGLMCPSFRATHEEEHSTRGRTHLLWEMTQATREDGIIRNGWQSEEVKDSLDLCLACKGCKSECPVSVDVATYKAEFLSHYYEGRRRPLNHYAFGNIDLWASLASNAPGIVNLATQLPFLRDIAKKIAGIPSQRKIPAFAPETFKQWFHRTRKTKSGGDSRSPGAPPLAGFARSGDFDSSNHRTTQSPDDAIPTVLLWPDTFNNYFLPATAQAAVEVLEAAGFHVTIPRINLCCGRPLYDFGMLDRAEKLLLQILDELAPEIEAGIPIVGLEPSCVAVFRDELLNLFPHDARAQKLASQTFLLSEFLDVHSKDSNSNNRPLPQLPRKALLHGHCHHKSIMKMTAEESLLHRIGIDFQSPAPGCCGMAGSFGFDHNTYEVSAAIGELELLPAVRQAPADWLIIADGFSCREQIAQSTNRHALHLAEVLQMALHSNPHAATSTDPSHSEHTGTPTGLCHSEPGRRRGEEPASPRHDPHPESQIVARRETAIRASMKRSALTLGALATTAFLLWKLSIKR
jgi:FAD/FMN-containing dehydrogenase/Fe-S oxidoreductase